MIECGKLNCKQRFIGETERMFKNRMYEHLDYVRNEKVDKVTGHQFNQKGHKITDMKFTILEKVKKNEIQYRKEREKQQINYIFSGMNQMP